MQQSIKDELVHTLDRLPLEQLLAVLHFARGLEQRLPEQAGTSAEGHDEKAAAAMADFFAAAGCGHSGDPNSALHIDVVLYGRQDLL
jgi:hypothetical protein